MTNPHDGDAPGPDLLHAGVPLDRIPDGGVLLGHAGDEEVLLLRDGDRVRAVGARCTHYDGPLADGLRDGDRISCPWHHATFDADTGTPLEPPALDDVPCYRVIRQSGLVKVDGRRRPAIEGPTSLKGPGSITILGGGAAGAAAVETLRREGYQGPITLVAAEPSGPVDRPNLSKDYLAGKAEEDWIPLRPASFYEDRHVRMVLGRTATELDAERRTLLLDDGQSVPYEALLLATGAEPRQLSIPGVPAPHVFTLRSLGDSQNIVEAASAAHRAVVVGASFLGMEVAASLRQRGLEVRVVAPEQHPLLRVLGPELGQLVREIHEDHGVELHLRHTLQRVEPGRVVLDDGTPLAADLVVTAVGVEPRTRLAEAAGLEVDDGVLVDERLRTSREGIWAAGDVARWPGPQAPGTQRIEHWVTAQKLGQAAARSILGDRRPFDGVPFFWSMHYDVPIAYVGHAGEWDRTEVRGSVADRDALVGYRRDGRIRAVASVFRDGDSLRAERALREGDDDALEALFSG